MSEHGMGRRSFVKMTGGVTGAALLGGCAGSGSGGGNYPSGDIRNVIPYASGGGFDAYARLSEKYWGEHLGGNIVTENVTGGGGVTAATQLYNAEPNGQTIMIWAPSESLPSQIGRDVGYDIREMSHIGFLTQSPSTIILREEAGVDTWDDLASKMPDLNWATQGVGTMAHVGLYIMAELTGAFSVDDVNFVHYNGTGEVLAGLERGEANAFLINTATSGAKVINSIKGTEMFLVFSNREAIGDYLKSQGVEVGHWGAELDVGGMEKMGTVSSMRRFYTGPPEVPDDILKVQREAFQNIIKDQDFLDEAKEAGRPVIDPAGHEEVDDIIQQSYDLLSSEPYRGTLEEAF